jgi:hypothetical protein
MVGELAGEHLLRHPAQIVGFDEARAAEPDALALSRETSFSRDYGRNPYVGYDEIGSPAFLFTGPCDGRLQPKARVITLEAPRPLADDFDDLRDKVVTHDEVDGVPLLLLWAPGTTTAIGGARTPRPRTSAPSTSSGPKSTADGWRSDPPATVPSSTPRPAAPEMRPGVPTTGRSRALRPACSFRPLPGPSRSSPRACCRSCPHTWRSSPG